MAEGQGTQRETLTSAEASTPPDPTAVAIGRLLFFAVVVIVAMLEVLPFVAAPESRPEARAIFRWAIMAVIVFRTWQGAPSGILASRLGLGVGAITYFCLALISASPERLLSLFNSGVYAALALTMVYSRSIRAYLGEEDEAESHAAAPTASSGPGQPVSPDWPRCPECGAPRLTRCPYCRTSGTSFAKADHPPSAAAFGAGSEVDVFHPAEGSSCSCSHAGCGAEAHPGEEPEDASGMCVCPMCDEPFHPDYLRQCEWCGHDFGEGFVAESLATQHEPVNVRVVAVMIGLVIFAVATLTYFALLIPPQK